MTYSAIGPRAMATAVSQPHREDDERCERQYSAG
jgi:hypothetical protein